MMIDNLLATNTKIFGKDILFGQGRQITIFVSGVHPFVNRVVISQMRYNLFNEFLVLDEVVTAQMEDARFVPVDEVMDLLGKPIVVGNINDQVRKHLYGLFAVQMLLELLYPGRSVSKNHRDP